MGERKATRAAYGETLVELGAKYPMSEVITIDGEQPVYDYIMILE